MSFGGYTVIQFFSLSLFIYISVCMFYRDQKEVIHTYSTDWNVLLALVILINLFYFLGKTHNLTWVVIS